MNKENTSGLECIDGEWVSKTPEPRVVEDVDLNISDEPVEKVCGGCEIEGVCFEYGVRFNDSFCSGSGSILRFLEGGEDCSFDYECLSGKCKGEKCYESSLLEKIVEFFKDLF